MPPRMPHHTGDEHSSLGPAWKVEARGVWKRELRRVASDASAPSQIPIVLRVRELRAGVFGWEVWSGQRVSQSGEAKSALEATEHAEYVAGATASMPGQARISTLTASRRLGAAKAPPQHGQGSALAHVATLLVGTAWVAQGVALWLGVGSAALLAATLAATIALAWLFLGIGARR